MADCFGWSDFFARHLRRLGHQAEEIVGNAEPLQRQWARENGVQVGSNWEEEIVRAQLLRTRPDVIFWQDATCYGPESRRRITEGVPLRLQVANLTCPWSGFDLFKSFDVIFTFRDYLSALHAVGIRTALLPHAFEASLLDRIRSPARSRALTFAGGLTRSHSGRLKVVRKLLRSTPLEGWSDQEPYPGRSMARRALRLAPAALCPLTRRLLIRAHESVPPWRWLRERWHPAAFGVDMYRLLASSRIVLNAHIDARGPYRGDFAGNMRLFEATGMGALLLTDAKSNLADLFEPEREIVTYATASECLEKVRYLLDHEDERATIAAAGQRRTLSDHRLGSRVEEVALTIAVALKATNT